MYYKKILAAALTVSCIGGIVPANSVQAASLKLFSSFFYFYSNQQSAQFFVYVSVKTAPHASYFLPLQYKKCHIFPVFFLCSVL